MAREFAAPLLGVICENDTPRILGQFAKIDDLLDAFFDESAEFDTPTSRMFIVELGDPKLRVTQLPAEALPEGCVR